MKLEADRKLDRVCPRPDLRVVLRLMFLTVSQIDNWLLPIRYLIQLVRLTVGYHQFVI